MDLTWLFILLAVIAALCFAIAAWRYTRRSDQRKPLLFDVATGFEIGPGKARHTSVASSFATTPKQPERAPGSVPKRPSYAGGPSGFTMMQGAGDAAGKKRASIQPSLSMQASGNRCGARKDSTLGILPALVEHRTHAAIYAPGLGSGGSPAARMPVKRTSCAPGRNLEYSQAGVVAARRQSTVSPASPTAGEGREKRSPRAPAPRTSVAPAPRKYDAFATSFDVASQGIAPGKRVSARNSLPRASLNVLHSAAAGGSSTPKARAPPRPSVTPRGNKPIARGDTFRGAFSTSEI